MKPLTLSFFHPSFLFDAFKKTQRVSLLRAVFTLRRRSPSGIELIQSVLCDTNVEFTPLLTYVLPRSRQT